MASCNAEMPSYTYAKKGEKLLKARGFSCEIKRNEKTSTTGCGFSLHIHNNCANALDILKKSSIPYNQVNSGGA